MDRYESVFHEPRPECPLTHLYCDGAWDKSTLDFPLLLPCSDLLLITLSTTYPARSLVLQPSAQTSQLLLAPPFAALNSSIFATLFLNSSYWHFS